MRTSPMPHCSVVAMQEVRKECLTLGQDHFLPTLPHIIFRITVISAGSIRTCVVIVFELAKTQIICCYSITVLQIATLLVLYLNANRKVPMSHTVDKQDSGKS